MLHTMPDLIVLAHDAVGHDAAFWYVGCKPGWGEGGAKELGPASLPAMYSVRQDITYSFLLSFHGMCHMIGEHGQSQVSFWKSEILDVIIASLDQWKQMAPTHIQLLKADDKTCLRRTLSLQDCLKLLIDRAGWVSISISIDGLADARSTAGCGCRLA